MNAKKDNQYYGKYFEYLVACILNKELPCLSAGFCRAEAGCF